MLLIVIFPVHSMKTAISYCCVFKHIKDLNPINDNQDVESNLKILSEATIHQPHRDNRKKRIALQYYNINFHSVIQHRTYIFHTTETPRLHSTDPDCTFKSTSSHFQSFVGLFKTDKNPYFDPTGTVESSLKKRQLHLAISYGEAFFINVFREDGKTQHILSLIQYKPFDFGAVINFLGTTEKPMNSQNHGTTQPFLEPDTSFRGLGLAVTLLRALQLHLCCQGHPPHLYIQSQSGSELESFLLRRGFVIYDGDGSVPNLGPDQSPLQYFKDKYKIQHDQGVVWHSDYVLLVLREVAFSKGQNSRWIQKVCPTWKYHRSQHSDHVLKFPLEYPMFKFPFDVDGAYVDQCTKGLVILGCPFFFIQKQSQIIPMTEKAQIAQIYGRHYRAMESAAIGGSRSWATSEHLQLVCNWVMRDANNYFLQRFHIVPTLVTEALSNLFHARAVPDMIGQVLHKYCSEHWRNLHSFLLFLFKNVNLNHWVLQVAVNPHVMLSSILQPEDDFLSSLVYGYMYIDPQETKHRDGSTDSNNPDNMLKNNELIFLLNLMSRYRDKFLNKEPMDLHDSRLTKLWMMGACGPFGRVFREKDKATFDMCHTRFPLFHYPLIKAPLLSFPYQTDGWNCGIYGLVSIIDFIIVQWNRDWFKKDIVMQHDTSDPMDNWWKQVANFEPIRLPESYSIGSGFARDPSTTTDATYTRICAYLRMEMAILMERLHCIYHNAFYDQDSVTDSSVLGVLRKEYIERITHDQDMVHVYYRFMHQAPCPDLRQMTQRHEKEIQPYLNLTTGLPIFQAASTTLSLEEEITEYLRHDFLGPLSESLPEFNDQNADGRIDTVIAGLLTTQLREVVAAEEDRREEAEANNLISSQNSHGGRLNPATILARRPVPKKG